MTTEQVKAMVRGYLSTLDPSRWQLSPDGSHYRVIQGSTAAYVSFYLLGEHVVVQIKARVLEGVPESAPLQLLPVINGQLPFAKFCYYPSEQAVTLEYELLGASMDQVEFTNALALVADIADKWDERLRDEHQFGGHVHIDAGAGHVG